MNEYEILNKLKLNIAIQNYKNEFYNTNTLTKKSINIKNKILKSIGIATCIVTSATGIVFATKALYHNIWEEPERVENFYIDNKIDNVEFEAIVTEEEAIDFANELLKRFGYEDEEIVLVELKNHPTNSNLEWKIETKNTIRIFINAKDINSYSIFTEMMFITQEIKDYRGTKEEMIDVAKRICEEQGYDLSVYNNIDVTHNLVNPEDSYIWYVNFNNKYNGKVNRYTKNIFVGILPEINAPYWFIVNDCEFDDNPIEITEEKAREIAIEEDKTIDHGYNIIGVESILDIAKMNGDEYLRKNDYKQFYIQNNTENYNIEDIVYYRTKNSIRNCWMVTVRYDCIEEKDINRQYTYFIDATTGEIIGGNPMYMYGKF